MRHNACMGNGPPVIWLGFLDTYRTLCVAPNQEIRSIFDELRSFSSSLRSCVTHHGRKPNEFEANIIWRAADLLGVSSRQRVALRQLVLADNAALARVGVGRPQAPADP